MGKGLSGGQKAAIAALAVAGLVSLVFFWTLIAASVVSVRDDAILQAETRRQERKEIAEREQPIRTTPLTAGDGVAPSITFWIESAAGQFRRERLTSGTHIELLEPKDGRPPPAESECSTRSASCFVRIRVTGGSHTDTVGFIQKWDYSARR